jgi:anti-sigma factor RsiW
MTCHDVLDNVEAIAAGDLAPDASTRTHLETCPQCSAALAAATRIEAYLASRPAPPPPARFTSAVLQRIRRERWRSEQRVDALFNAAMVAAGVLVLVGAGFFFNIGATMELAAGASRVLSAAGEEALRRAAPSLGTYVAATALLVSALAMWWWAEAATE